MQQVTSISLLNIISVLLLILLCLSGVVNLFSQELSSVSAGKQNVITSTEINTGLGSNFTSNQGNIYKNDQKIDVFGASWFGMEDDGLSPHALWNRNLTDIILQVKNMGFTALRVPFCPNTLKNLPTGYISDTANPSLVGLKSLDLMDKFVEELNNQGIYILLDIHNYTCTNTLPPLWYTSKYSEQQLITDLTFVANRYKSLPNFMGIDIKNEPHDGITLETSSTWGTGNIATDWNQAAERIGKAILETNPNLLIFVEGIGDLQTTCSDEFGAWWGGNLMPIRCTPINPVFIPADKLVLSPHVYGPDVYYANEFKTTDFPNNLPAYWDKYFGFTQRLGNTLAIGEFGGKYGHDDQFSAANPKDILWQNKIVDYFIEKKICNFFYWSLNPDSDDTGGIFQPNWKDPWSDKLANLQRLMNSCKTPISVNPPVDTIPLENWSITKIRSRLWQFLVGKLIR
jgi:endoglucanase